MVEPPPSRLLTPGSATMGMDKSHGSTCVPIPVLLEPRREDEQDRRSVPTHMMSGSRSRGSPRDAGSSDVTSPMAVRLPCCEPPGIAMMP